MRRRYKREILSQTDSTKYFRCQTKRWTPSSGLSEASEDFYGPRGGKEILWMKKMLIFGQPEAEKNVKILGDLTDNCSSIGTIFCMLLYSSTVRIKRRCSITVSYLVPGLFLPIFVSNATDFWGNQSILRSCSFNCMYKYFFYKKNTNSFFWNLLYWRW